MPTTRIAPNTWSIARRIGKLKIKCEFVAVPEAVAWGMTVTVNRVVVEHRMSEHPLQDSEIAILNAVSLLHDEVDTTCQSSVFPFKDNAVGASESTP